MQRVVATRSTDKLLDGILLVADQELVLTGYDNETGIEYRMEADISRKGDIVVPAKFLSEVVRKLPDNHVYLEVQEDNILIVESGNSKFRLRGYPADKYPEIRFVEEESRIVVKQKTLRDMINQTIFAASTDYHSRSALTGLNLICERDSLTLVAIDGFRLAIRHETVPGMDIDINIVIPAKAMAEIARIMSDGDEEVVILPSHNYIIFDKGNVKLVTRLIKSEYMNYRSIIPREADSSLIISPEVLLAAIERASIMIETDDRRFPVTLSMPNNDTMIIESRTNIGEAKEDIPIALAGDRVEIDFNPRFFIEVLREIEMCIRDSVVYVQTEQFVNEFITCIQLNEFDLSLIHIYLSESALGWCTYNGDHMSMYAVNASVSKTAVRYLVETAATLFEEGESPVELPDDKKKTIASVLREILSRPISPELLPPHENDSLRQITEDVVGPYEVIDFFLWHMVFHGKKPSDVYDATVRVFSDTYDEASIERWLKNFIRRFFRSQFKRSASPEGVAAFPVSYTHLVDPEVSHRPCVTTLFGRHVRYGA